MNYFEAKRAEKALRAYRELAFRYWAAKPSVETTGYEWMSERRPYAESAESADLRRELSETYPQISVFAQHLGVPTRITSYPAPAIGGPILEGDLLNSIVDQRIGHSSVSRHEVVDAIDRCIGMAESIQKHLFWKQAANPIYYVVITLAFLIRMPSLILQHAGLPEEVEHTLWGHIVKVILLLMLSLFFVHYGLKFNLSDLINFFK